MTHQVILGAQVERLDALTSPGTGLFFKRQLEFISPEVLRKRLPPLNGMRMVAVRTDVPVGPETYTFRMYEPLGVAKFISDYADDLPSVDVAAKEETFKIHEIGASYQYSMGEIEAARYANTNLDLEKAMAARRAIDERINQLIWYGDAAHGLHGFTNYPYIPREALAEPLDATASDNDAILNTMNTFCNAVHNESNQTERATRLIMPQTQFSYIANTRLSAASDTTILQYFLSNQQWVKEVLPANELAGAGYGGEDLMIAYDPDPRVVKFVLPRPFTQKPAQERNLAMVINCHSRVGGVCSQYPRAARIGILP